MFSLLREITSIFDVDVGRGNGLLPLFKSVVESSESISLLRAVMSTSLFLNSGAESSESLIAICIELGIHWYFTLHIFEGAFHCFFSKLGGGGGWRKGKRSLSGSAM